MFETSSTDKIIFPEKLGENKKKTAKNNAMKIVAPKSNLLSIFN